LKIGQVEIRGRTALAPMAGVADRAFRTVCREFGAAYEVGEMASAKGITLGDRKSAELLTVTGPERPMAVQLFGDDPRVMAEAARCALAYGPDVIDINMGCPAPKITSNKGGSALMKDPALAGRIVEAVASAVPVPVTVKIRKGWDETRANAVEIARVAESGGAAALTVHGRTRMQMYAPPVDLDIIAQVKAAVHIPVIGNGDIFTPQDAAAMFERTGCDLVMIGRGAMGCPWIFRAVERYLADGTLLEPPGVEERMRVMLRHIRLLCEYKGERTGMREARKHAAWYMRGLRGAASLRADAGGLRTFPDLEALAARAAECPLAENTRSGPAAL
jgi:nifR3 family TIM-barrel protein